MHAFGFFTSACSTAFAGCTQCDEDRPYCVPFVYNDKVPFLDLRYDGQSFEECTFHPHPFFLEQLYCVRLLAMGDRTGIWFRSC